MRYLRLGSGQILLLTRVRETLAGRAGSEESWPLALPGLITTSFADPVLESGLASWLRQGAPAPGGLLGTSAESRTYARTVALFERFVRFERLAKMPRIHFSDPGILRTVLGRRGEPSGEEFESAVVAEIWKQVRNAKVDACFHWLRTHDGREIDLLIEIEAGLVAIEIKQASRVSGADARHLRRLQQFLDRPLLAGLVLSLDVDARPLDPATLALPVAWALGPVEPDR